MQHLDFGDVAAWAGISVSLAIACTSWLQVQRISARQMLAQDQAALAVALNNHLELLTARLDSVDGVLFEHLDAVTAIWQNRATFDKMAYYQSQHRCSLLAGKLRQTFLSSMIYNSGIAPHASRVPGLPPTFHDAMLRNSSALQELLKAEAAEALQIPNALGTSLLSQSSDVDDHFKTWFEQLRELKNNVFSMRSDVMLALSDTTKATADAVRRKGQ